MGRMVFDDDGGSRPKAARSAGTQHAADDKGKQGPKGRGPMAATQLHGATRGHGQHDNGRPGKRPHAALQELRGNGAAPSRQTVPNSKAQQGVKRKQAPKQDTEFFKRALKRMEAGPDGDGDDSLSDLSDLSDEEPMPVKPQQHQQQQQLLNPLKQPRQQTQQQPDSDSEDGDADDGDDAGDSDAEHSSQSLDGGSGEGVDVQGQGEASEDEGEDGEDEEGSEGLGGPGSDSPASSDEEGEDDSEDPDPEGAMQQLAELPLEVRLALLQDGGGPQGQVARAAAQAARVQEESFKRLNRHRPQEMSSKRPVSRYKEVVEPTRKTAKDPRFVRLQSDVDKEAAARRYAFLYDDVLAKERTDLKTRIRAEHKPGAKAALAAQLQRVDQALSRETQRRTRKEVETKFKVQQRGAVAAGKTPYFLKAADKKKLELVAKYEQLKKKGKLDRFMEKRRKHNASKDHRYLPSGRRGEDQDE